MAWVQEASDNFTRADSSGLGPNWTNHLSSADIVSNTARAHTASTVVDPIYSAVSLQNDQYSTITIGTLSSASQFVSCGVRMSSSVSQGYLALVTGPLGASAKIQIQNHSSGATLGSNVTATINAGDVVRIEAKGTQITAFVNGVQKSQVTDSSTASGSAGITFFVSATANGQLTSFTCGDSPVKMQGLIGEYAFTDDSGTTLTDVSGSGNNGTLGSGGNAPTWIGGTTHGMQFNGGQYVSLPSGMNLSTGSIQTYLGYNATADLNLYSAPLIGNDNSASASNGLVLSKDTNGTFGQLARSISGGSRAWVVGPGVVSAVCRSVFQGNGDIANTFDPAGGANSNHVYIDGTEDTVGSGALATRPSNYFTNIATAAQTSGNYQIGGAAAGSGFASQTYYTGKIYYMLVYNRVLSAAEVSFNSAGLQSLMTPRGVSGALNGTDINSMLVTDGDSITEGYSASVGSGLTPWTAMLSLQGSWKIANQGRASAWLTDLVTCANQTVDTMYHPNGPRKVCVIWGGTNDITGVGSNGISAAACYAQLQSYCASRKSIGWKTIVVPMLSRTGTVSGGPNAGNTIDSVKTAYNILIHAGVGIDFDALADLSTSPVFDLTANGASTNLTYFQDGIHPTQTAINLIIAPIIGTSINTLAPGGVANSLMLMGVGF